MRSRTKREYPRCQTVVMTAELTSVTDALEALTDIEVRALKTAASEAPAVANGLLVWLEGACDSEINRRFGRDYDLLPPQAATDLSEADASIKGVHAMRESFASSDFAPPSRSSSSMCWRRC